MSAYTWRAFDMVFFDCDSTLSTIEGIDELAREKNLFNEVKSLTDAAMGGEVHLESVYDKRLQLLKPTRGQIRRIERAYRETLVPQARQVISALQYLGKQVFIVSGGLYAAVRPFGEWLGVPAENIRAVEVEFDPLSGDWWDYQRDRWGQRPDVHYHKHDNTPLVESAGKADVVRQLKGTQPGRSMLIGDGMSDLAARPAVDRIIGFGGVVTRAGVFQEADIFITCNSLAPVLPLACSPAEGLKLQNTPHQALLAQGLAYIEQDAVRFQKEKWRQALLSGPHATEIQASLEDKPKDKPKDTPADPAQAPERDAQA